MTIDPTGDKINPAVGVPQEEADTSADAAKGSELRLLSIRKMAKLLGVDRLAFTRNILPRLRRMEKPLRFGTREYWTLGQLRDFISMSKGVRP